MTNKRQYKYETASEQLLRRIEQLQDGEKLPNRNELARSLGIARTTLEHAIAELIAQGRLAGRQGSGTYVVGAGEARPTVPARSTSASWALLLSSVLNDLYPSIVRAVQDVAHRHGVNLIICNTDHQTRIQDEYLRKLADDGVRGAVIVPAVEGDTDPAFYRALAARGFHIVACFRPITGFLTEGVYCDSFEAGLKGTLHLLDQGCRNVAFLNSPMYQTAYERMQGYLAAMTLRGRPRSCELISHETSHEYETAGAPAAARLLAAHPEIDGIFAFNDRLAAQTYRILREQGREPGKDVRIIGCDDSAVCTALEPRLTSIAFPAYEVGQRAAECLWALTEGERVQAPPFAFGCDLVVRASSSHI